MNRIVSLLALVFICATQVQADKNDLVELCKSLDYSKIDIGLNMLEKTPPNEGERYSVKRLVNNELVSNYWQVLYAIERVELNPDDPMSFSTQLFRIELFRQSNDVIYFLVEEYDQDQKQRINFWKDKQISQVNTFLKTYQDSFGRALTPDNMFVHDVQYGTKCGNNGTILPYRRKLIEAINNTDTAQMIEWLGSGVVEKQFFGLEGLLQMQKDGLILEPQTINTMERFKTKGGELNYCTGKTIRRRSIKDTALGIFSRFEKEE